MLIKTYKTKITTVRAALAVLCLSLVFLGGSLSSVFAEPAASSHTQIYAIGCTSTTTVTLVNSPSLKCTSNGNSKVPNNVTLQAIGSKSSSKKPYPNTLELRQFTVTCSGAGNSPKDPQLGKTVTSFADFKCTNGKAGTVSNYTTIPAAKKPSKKVDPYTVDGSGKTVTAKPGTKTATPSDNKKSVCGNGDCADPAADPKATCSQDNCDLIKKYVNPAITLLSVTFGIIAVISLIIGGIQYSSSGGDPQKVGAAKKRIQNTIVAVIAYFFLYSFLQFLIPGGVFR
jgi:hypothetical protein